MGPIFVLMIWAVIATLLSVAGGGVLIAVVGRLLPDAALGRKRAMRIAALLPAAGFAYLFICVVLFSVWSVGRGRDLGWGDTWDTPILASYHLTMIDVTDSATLSNQWKPVIFGVRRLEVRPPMLFGTASPEKFAEYPLTSPETLFFVLDTRDGTRTDKPTLRDLEKFAISSGGPLKLKPVAEIYDQFQYDRFDLFPLIVFTLPAVIAMFFLIRGLLRLRAGAEDCRRASNLVNID